MKREPAEFDNSQGEKKFFLQYYDCIYPSGILYSLKLA